MPNAGAAQLEVFHQRMASVAEAMGARLQRSAYSANIKERLDFSCAVFDAGGRLIAQAAHIPVHLGALPAAVAAARAFIGPRGWRPGDVVLANDPYAGGSHLPDLTTVSPVFAGDARRGTAARPAAFLATRAHHADVGGSAPGSLPIAADLFGEGLILPPVRLVQRGRLAGDVLRIICANSRSPDERRADLEAQLGAHRLGDQELAHLIGSDAAGFQASCGALLDYSESRARRVLAGLPSGIYRQEDALEGDGWTEAPIAIRIALTVDDDGLTADFTGTDPQTKGGVNAPLAVTQSAVFYVLACLVDDTPINAGLFAPVKIVAPLGSLLNPRPPAAVAAGNVETSQRIVDVVLAALARALPDRVPAASQGTMNNLIFGIADPVTGRMLTYYETMGGGGGAGPAGAGQSGRQVHMTNTLNTPVEALELAYPVRVEAYRLRQGSGGRGRFAGGEGLERALRFLAPAEVTLVAERRRSGPPGANGGEAGAPGRDTLVRADGREVALPAKATFPVEAGDTVWIRTPGGGGWGRAESEPTGTERTGTEPTGTEPTGTEATGTEPPGPERSRSEAQVVEPIAVYGQDIQDDEQRAGPAEDGEQQ